MSLAASLGQPWEFFFHRKGKELSLSSSSAFGNCPHAAATVHLLGQVTMVTLGHGRARKSDGKMA